jgi:hypothetical protein
MFRDVSRIFSPAMPVTNNSIHSGISDRFFLNISVGWKKVMPHGKRWAARLVLASALLAPQACFADLIDKYMNADPFSWKLFEVPKVRDSMRKVLGRERLKFVRELDRLGDFEELQDPEFGRVLFVFLFLKHVAPVHASLFIRSNGETVAACTSDYDDTPGGKSTVWSGSDWQLKTKDSGCPIDSDDALKRLSAAKASAKGERLTGQQ